jgi:hypothetical protein
MSRAKSGAVFQVESWGEIIATERGRLGITFDSRPVTQITRTVAVLWNSTTDSISSRDVGRPVLFTYDGEVLAFRECSKRGSDIALHLGSRGQLCCRFDLLQPGDGISFEALHTGSDTSARCEGSIKGIDLSMPKIPPPIMEREFWGGILALAQILGLLALVSIGIIVSIAELFPHLITVPQLNGSAALGAQIGLFAALPAAIVILIWAVWKNRHKDPDIVDNPGIPGYLLRDIHTEWRQSPIWQVRPGKQHSEVASEGATSHVSHSSSPYAAEAILRREDDSHASPGRPKFASEGRLIADSYGRLGRTYEGKRVARISRTIIALWSAANERIVVDEVGQGFIFHLDGSILAWRCYGVRPKNAGLHQNDAYSLALSVDELAPGDGVCLEVIHSGKLPQATCAGTTKARRRIVWPVISVLIDLAASFASWGNMGPGDYSDFSSWRRFGIPRDLLGQLDSGLESELL